MLDIRAKMRDLHGAAYKQRTEPWRGYIQKAMAKANCNELEAILHLEQLVKRKGGELSAMDVGLLTSAAVDLITESEK